MKRVKTTITYKVPDWQYCNHSCCGKPTKDKCRFCVKYGKSHVCVLHNMPLDLFDGVLIKKTEDCIRATCGFKSEVKDEDIIQADPKTVMKLTLQEYRKAYNKFIKQGYPDAIADKMAQQLTMGGA